MTKKNKEIKEDFYPMRQETFLQQGLNDMLKSLEFKMGPLNEKIMVEIGSYIGDSAKIFAKHFGLVICIDPFMDWYDEDDDTCYFARMAQVEQMFDLQTKDFNNIVKIKLKSDDAAEFAKAYKVSGVDFVYIDGLHTYEQVKKDILNFAPFLSETQMIGGHDYHANWSGVKKAVDEIIGNPDEVFCDTSWIKKIETINK